MKKFLILLIVAAATFSVQLVSAQCNSKLFERNLATYNNLVAKDAFTNNYDRQKLILGMDIQIAVVRALDSAETETDYATFLSQVNVEKYLPQEAKEPVFAGTDKDQYTEPEILNNFGLLKHLNKAYSVYQVRFELNKFTKSAKKFVKKQVKIDGSVKKDITSYSNYQLFILHHFGGVNFTTKDFGHDAIQSIVAQLKSSNCPAYTKLADEIVKNL